MCVQQCVVKEREVLKKIEWKRVRERERESKLILIASLTVSVGFSTPRSTRYKGKSGGEVRKRRSILIYCPTTVLLTTLSTMLLSVGHFESWIKSHLLSWTASTVQANFTLQLVLWAGQSFYMEDLALVLYCACTEHRIVQSKNNWHFQYIIKCVVRYEVSVFY